MSGRVRPRERSSAHVRTSTPVTRNAAPKPGSVKYSVPSRKYFSSVISQPCLDVLLPQQQVASSPGRQAFACRTALVVGHHGSLP